MDNYIQHEHHRYQPVHPHRPMPHENWPYGHHPDSPNDPQFADRGPRFERHIYLQRDDIFYDIDAQLGIIADTRRNSDGTEDDKLANATEKFRPMFLRWIDKHILIIKGIMAAFILDKFKTTASNSIKDNDEVDIELTMPMFWDDTVFEQLSSAVHDYITNAVLFEFLTLTLTSKDTVTVDKRALMQEALENVREYANAAKPGFIKKQHNPF